MADRVYEQKVILVGEDEDIELTIRTNTIARQRKFQEAFYKLQKEEEARFHEQEEALEKWKAEHDGSDEGFEYEQQDNYSTVVRLAAVCLEKAADPYIEGPKFKGLKPTSEYINWIEENIDPDSLYEIIKVCGGVDLSPKTIAALAQMQNQAGQE